MKLSEVPAFSQVRVLDFGSINEVYQFPHTIDEIVTVWTKCESDDNPFSTVRTRGLVDQYDAVVWFAADAQVEVVEPPRFAGPIEDLLAEARPMKTPAGSNSPVFSPEGWPPLIWASDLIFSPVAGLTDPELAVEILLCAIAVAPTAADADLLPMLLSALRARIARLEESVDTYPPDRYPWRNNRDPSEDLLDYLIG